MYEDFNSEDEELVFDEKEVANYYSDDAYKSYIHSIAKFPSLPWEEVKELFDKYRAGDLGARERIIDTHLKFVVMITKKYAKRLTHMEFLDAVSEGNLGLMRAIETYDYSPGYKFTTYAAYWIRQAVTRGVALMDDEIRKPLYFKQLINKYYVLTGRAEMEGKELSDEEICEKLEITQTILDEIRKTSYNTPVSMNSKVSDEEIDGEELGDFVVSYDNSLEEAINKMDTDINLAKLRLYLNDLQYYVLYYRYYSDDRYTLDSLAKELGISRERIRQIEAKALRLSQRLMINKPNMYKREELVNVRTKPITPEQIIMFNYIKDKVSYIERELLYNYFFSKKEYSFKELGRMVNLSEENVGKVLNKLVNLMRKEMGTENYKFYKKELLNQYKGSLYSNDFVRELEIINYDYYKNTYLTMKYDELKKLIHDNNIFLPNDLDVILRSMLSKRNNIDKEKVERELNLEMGGYKVVHKNVDIDKLKDIYIINKFLFTSSERLYLECYYFKIAPKEYCEEYNQDKMDKIIKKLEMIYYHINNLDVISYSLYYLVKDMYLEEFTKEEIDILDMYYQGVTDYSNGRIDFLLKTIHKLNSIYYDNRDFINIKKDKYKAYVIKYDDNSIVFEYFIYNKSIREIMKLHNMTNIEVIDHIKKEIKVFDLERFSIFDGVKINRKELLEALSIMKPSIIERQIIILKFLDRISDKQIIDSFCIDEDLLSKVIENFKNKYLEIIAGISGITARDILNEYNMYKSDSILNDRERDIIDKYYIKNYFKEDILKEFDINEKELNSIIYAIKNKIKACKIGIITTSNYGLTRTEVLRVLKDERITFTDREMDIIKRLFEIDGYEYSSLEDIAKDYNMELSTLREEFKDLVLKIRKYNASELNKNMVYEDIEGYYDYYSSYDKGIILDYYKEKMSKDKVAKLHNIKNIDEDIKRIEYTLYLLKNKNSKIDFTYYDAMDQVRIPSSHDNARDMFILFYGENGMERKSIKELDSIYHVDNIFEIIKDYELGIFKYIDGLKNNKVIPYDEVKAYYERYKDNMSEEKLNMYKRYLNGEIDITEDITIDVLKEFYTYTYLDSLDTETIINIIKNYKDILDEYLVDDLINILNIDKDKFIADDKIKELYKLLIKLDNKLSKGETLKKTISL